jgi:hypothetical protein
LHLAAARFGEQKSKLVPNPGVASAIERDLIECLIGCLSPEKERNDLGVWRHRTEVLGRLEVFLEANSDRSVSADELATAVGVSDVRCGHTVSTALASAPVGMCDCDG